MKLIKTVLVVLLALVLMSISYAAIAWVVYAATALLTGSVTAGLWVSAISVLVCAVFLIVLFACVRVGAESDEA